MSTVTIASTATPATRIPRWLHAIGAVVAGALVTLAFEGVTRALGVPYVFGMPGAEPAEMPATGLFFAVLEVGVIAMIIAACFARWATRPRSTWLRTTVTLTAVSVVPSLIASSTTYTTNVSLAVSHVVAAAVIIPMIASRLAEHNPRRA